MHGVNFNPIVYFLGYGQKNCVHEHQRARREPCWLLQRHQGGNNGQTKVEKSRDVPVCNVMG